MNDRASSAVVDADLMLADGRRLGYAVWGEPEGQPALLFHGSPGSRLFCPDPVATAAAGVRLVTVDRPGYGRSAAAPDGASWTGPRTSSSWSPRWVSTALR
jgi:pimeloyl-ACP methyl ester carboxylesterase